MEALVTHIGAVQFEIVARKHSIICDQPQDNGGFDEGVTPPELLLASLGSCAAFYAAMYLKKYKLSNSGTRVRVAAEKLRDPTRIDNFTIEIEAPVPLTAEHRNGVQEAVHRCLVHNTLRNPPQITMTINDPQG